MRWDGLGQTIHISVCNCRDEFATNESGHVSSRGLQWTTRHALQSRAIDADKSGAWLQPTGAGMSSSKQIRYTRGLAPFDLQEKCAYRRLDFIDKPARPLGTKSAALLARRRRTPSPKRAHPTPNTPAKDDLRVVASADSTLTFAMRPTARGMLVERTHCRSLGPRIVLLMVFETSERFDRWCASEPVRFDDPMLFEQLCRQGHEVLCSRG